MPRYKMMNNVRVQFTAEEEAERDAHEKAWADTRGERLLEEIKQIRLQKLKETDWYSNSDVTMPDNVKTWRQTLRDLPANHTNEAAYDALLARDSDGNLTNSVWSKP
tara:strand:+ start:188 stop:508 length:321 start_codon:yes stop_codon:yes gene_type:complete